MGGWDEHGAWVARDDSGEWRSYCRGDFAADAGAALRGMFHAVEVISIDGNTAMIDGGDS